MTWIRKISAGRLFALLHWTLLVIALLEFRRFFDGIRLERCRVLGPHLEPEYGSHEHDFNNRLESDMVRVQRLAIFWEWPHVCDATLEWPLLGESSRMDDRALHPVYGAGMDIHQRNALAAHA